jgi:pyrroline-5-carboxylate reductase
MKYERIGFVGAGQMAKALAAGMVKAGIVAADRITAFDPFPKALEDFEAAVPGAKRAASNANVVAASDVVLLAVKPQSFAAASQEMKPSVTPQKLIVSILAGTTIAQLTSGLGSDRIVRVMPNTPCLVGRGASGYACGTGCSADDVAQVGKMLGAVGIAFAVAETQLDAVTGLSGSGPAYVYVLIEALSDGGVRMGLPRNVATALAAQTVLGAAEMVTTTGEHPGVLKDRVASPGGTTIAGLHVLEQHGIRGALMSAVEAATRRSQELGKNS